MNLAFALLFMLQTAPTTYMADTSTTNKPQPSAPNFGPANSTIQDPTFGTTILRVTDANTASGRSFVPTDAGNHRTFNSNNTRIKLTGPQGDGWWLEFNPSAFQVGTTPHSIPSQYGATWEWSAVNPDIIYVLHGSAIASLNVTTGATTDLGSTPDGSAVAYFANVVGKDNWICAAAGPGQQDTWTRMYCLNVANPGASKYIDIVNRTVNGAYQSDPNWPNSGIGIHGMMGGTGDHHVELTFHGQNWGGNGDAVFNLNSNTWQLVKGQQVSGGDIYWGGHFSLGQGILANGAGNVSGNDSRGVVLRNADATMDSTQYHFIGQPSSPYNGWCDAEHTSWSNSLNNANAPVFQSRYISGCNYTWSSEIIALATDNSNTVYRFAHNYNGCPGSYYSQAFAQVSNDGMFVLFSSWWGGNLGGGSGFDCSSGRIDTFILKLVSGDAPPPPPTPPVLSISTQPTNMISGMTVMPDLTGTLLPAAAHTIVALADNTNCQLGGTTTTTANGTTGAWSLAGLTVTVTSPPQNCTIRVRDTSNGLVTDVVSNGFNVTVAAPETVTVSAEPSGMCQVQGTLTQTVVNQIFAFPNMTVTATVPPQNCQLRLHDSNPGVPDILSNVFTVLETAPTVPVLAFTQQPSTTIDGLTMTPAIAGTLTPGSIRTLTMTVNPSNCTLTGGSSTIQTQVNGNWSFPGLVAHAVGFPATCSVTIRDTSTTGAAATIVSMNFTINEVPTPPPPVTANRIILPRGIGK